MKVLVPFGYKWTSKDFDFLLIYKIYDEGRTIPQEFQEFQEFQELLVGACYPLTLYLCGVNETLATVMSSFRRQL
jgi:hypothetical protein